MRTYANTFCLLTLAAFVPGCVTMSPTDPYGGMAYSLREESQGFRPATSGPMEGPITLDKAIRIALANNPEVGASEREIEAAEAKWDFAKGQRLPRLDAVGSYNHHLDGQRMIAPRASGEPITFSRDLFAGDLVISMPVFTAGRISSEIQAAELLQKAAEHRLARTQTELVFNVSSVFYGILAQRKVIESLEFSLKALREHLKRVQDLIEAKKAAKVDQLRTEVRLADIEQRFVRERNVLEVQIRVLTNLLGLGHLDKPLEPAGELDLVKADVPATDQALFQALNNRSDYLSARAALEAQAKAVDAARAALWPTISLQGAYGGRWAADPTDRAAGANRGEDVGWVGLSAAIPIFEGGRIDARIREETAHLKAARERLRQLGLQIQLDVDTAVLNIRSAGERVKAMEKAIEQAKESLRIEREKYDLGKGTIVDVFDAQSALLESQTNYYRALADYNAALAQWRLAVGEGI